MKARVRFHPQFKFWYVTALSYTECSLESCMVARRWADSLNRGLWLREGYLNVCYTKGG